MTKIKNMPTLPPWSTFGAAEEKQEKKQENLEVNVPPSGALLEGNLEPGPVAFQFQLFQLKFEGQFSLYIL